MSLLCTKSGIQTTIQDLGRFGFRKLGVNPGGVMDQVAARLVNVLVGNRDSDAVLEMCFPTGSYRFESDTVFAIGGADFEATLNGERVNNWQLNFAAGGGEIEFAGKRKGNWAYLAIAGGFDIECWLDSRSTNLVARAGGFKGRTILKGDRVLLGSKELPSLGQRRMVSRSLIPIYSRFPTVRITEGAEFNLLDTVSKRRLFERDFSISNRSNRMGYHLEGEPLSLTESVEMVSSAVTFGTMQLLPDGQIIVLMADHQTTGGYPRFGHVVTQDLPLLAQLGPSDKVGFQPVSLEAAERAMIEFQNDLNRLKVGVRLANL
jgi:antagonist of KipI